MFKITKFVIAAALTAIIAAPIMAQEDECPCWPGVNLSDVGATVLDICEINFTGPSGTFYHAFLSGKNAAGDAEQANIFTDVTKMNCRLIYGNPPLVTMESNLDGGSQIVCLRSIKGECERRKNNWPATGDEEENLNPLDLD